MNLNIFFVMFCKSSLKNVTSKIIREIGRFFEARKGDQCQRSGGCNSCKTPLGCLFFWQPWQESWGLQQKAPPPRNSGMEGTPPTATPCIGPEAPPVGGRLKHFSLPTVALTLCAPPFASLLRVHFVRLASVFLVPVVQDTLCCRLSTCQCRFFGRSFFTRLTKTLQKIGNSFRAARLFISVRLKHYNKFFPQI